MEDGGERGSRQERTEMSAERFCYRRIFRKDEWVQWSVLEELELTVSKIVVWEAASSRMTSSDNPQPEKIAGLESKVEISGKQPDLSKTAPRWNKSRKSEKRRSSSESSSRTNSEELKRPKLSVLWEVQSVRAV